MSNRSDVIHSCVHCSSWHRCPDHIDTTLVMVRIFIVELLRSVIDILIDRCVDNFFWPWPSSVCPKATELWISNTTTTPEWLLFFRLWPDCIPKTPSSSKLARVVKVRWRHLFIHCYVVLSSPRTIVVGLSFECLRSWWTYLDSTWGEIHCEHARQWSGGIRNVAVFNWISAHFHGSSGAPIDATLSDLDHAIDESWRIRDVSVRRLYVDQRQVTAWLLIRKGARSRSCSLDTLWTISIWIEISPTISMKVFPNRYVRRKPMRSCHGSIEFLSFFLLIITEVLSSSISHSIVTVSWSSVEIAFRKTTFFRLSRLWSSLQKCRWRYLSNTCQILCEPHCRDQPLLWNRSGRGRYDHARGWLVRNRRWNARLWLPELWHDRNDHGDLLL